MGVIICTGTGMVSRIRVTGKVPFTVTSTIAGRVTVRLQIQMQVPLQA